MLSRDLEKLQAARAPSPVPSPVAPPAPMMDEPRRPAAVMMDMPSAAAHTVNSNAIFTEPQDEIKRQPFPDMGMGLSGDVVDLTSNEKPPTASPQVTADAAKPGTEAGAGTGPHASPSIKQSPQPASATTRITPVPAPQVPPQPTALGSSAQKAPTPNQQPPAAQAAQDSTLDATLTLPPTSGAATADMTGGSIWSTGEPASVRLRRSF